MDKDRILYKKNTELWIHLPTRGSRVSPASPSARLHYRTPRAAQSSGENVNPHFLHLTATLLLWYNSGELWDFRAAFVNAGVNLDKPVGGMV